MQHTQGVLFDIYHIEDAVYLWILDSNHKASLFIDTFYPTIYASGEEEILRKFTSSLTKRKVLLCPPDRILKKHFYQNKPIEVVRYKIKRPSFLKQLTRKLYVFYQKLDIYHSDIEIPTHYMYEKRIFPMAKVSIVHDDGKVLNIRADSDEAVELYPFKILKMSLAKSHRLGVSATNPLIFEFNNQSWEIPFSSPSVFLKQISEIFQNTDPDVVLSSYGDQVIFPFLFRVANQQKVSLNVDRDKFHTVRKIVTQGTSYSTYGSIIFRAASYPLFGRWHIDSYNSFVFKESRLDGILELASHSKIPVQKLARSSTGTAMTSMQTEIAYLNDYLVPWQKSHMEEPKTALELLTVDKGGLVYEPSIRESRVYENVAQCDYSQMYPTIMVHHNVSPETVRCSCCIDIGERVPESISHICAKRYGIVPQSLAFLLKRREFLKKQVKTTSGREKDSADDRQSSLKWLFVTSFGYLGYRNAKFGRLESHEAVTAFGRDKLLIAKEEAERKGFRTLHAITDCIFIQKVESEVDRRDDRDRFRLNHSLPVSTTPSTLSLSTSLEKEISDYCDIVLQKSFVRMAVEGIYNWVVFLSSRQDKETPIANRYFGRYQDGTLKVRGIAVRRKDTPTFIRDAQFQFLELMRQATSIQQLKDMHSSLHNEYYRLHQLLWTYKVPVHDLLLRRTISQEMDGYVTNNPSKVSLEQLAELGMDLAPGEKVRYLVVPKNSQGKKYLAEEKIELLLAQNESIVYCREHYGRLLLLCFEEVWESFAPPYYFKEIRSNQQELFR